MDITRAALTASLTTAVLWAVDAVVVGRAGGPNIDPLDGPLFLLGLAACVTSAVLLGLALTEGRSTGRRVLGVVLAGVAVAGFGALEAALISALAPAHPGWAWGEANLWVLALVLVAVSGALVVRRGRTVSARTVLS